MAPVSDNAGQARLAEGTGRMAAMMRQFGAPI